MSEEIDSYTGYMQADADAKWLENEKLEFAKPIKAELDALKAKVRVFLQYLSDTESGWWIEELAEFRELEEAVK